MIPHPSRACCSLFNPLFGALQHQGFGMRSFGESTSQAIDKAGVGALTTNRDRGRPHGFSPPTPPDMRVRIRRFGGLSHLRMVN
jgi:hypothetical protein